MKILFSLLVISALFPAIIVDAQVIKVVNFEEFQPIIQKNNDTTYVINFWATWCIPCVKELPYFEDINSEFKDRKFKMILVSLDFKSQMESSLIPFIEKKNIESEVILLSDPDANTWISMVNEDWTGSIPATIIYNKDHNSFTEGSLTYNELKETITKYIIE